MQKKEVSQVDAKEYLEYVEILDIHIANVQAKIDRYKASAVCITSQMGGERVQGSANKQKIAEAVAKYTDIEKDELLPLKRQRDDILNTLERVRGRLCYIVLYEHYFQRKSLKRIARERKYSYSHIARKHTEGLAKLQKIIDR